MLCFFTTLVIGYLPPLDNVLRVDPSLPVLTRSNRDYDLAELPASFEITMRIDNLVEWKHLVDDWFQRALLQTVDHEIDCRLLPFRISARSPDVVPFYRQGSSRLGRAEEQLW